MDMAAYEGTQDGLLHSIRSWQWGLWTKVVLTGAVVALIAFLVGSYAVGPGRIAAGEGYVPPELMQLPASSIAISNPDGSVAALPVRIADTLASRNAGLNKVGPRAMETTMLLYAYPQPRTATTRIQRNDLRAPVDLAVIDGSGQVLRVQTVAAGTTAFSVTGSHQWILAAKAGTLEKFGIVEGSQLDTASITRI